MKRFKHLPLLIVMAICLSACGSLTTTKPGPEISAEADEPQVLLAEVKDRNTTLKHFKGIGKIKLRQNGKTLIDERIAWIGSEPSKLSLVVLVSGFPAIKMASDGKWLYYLESGREETVYKKMRADDPSLKRLISIPIRTSEIVAILAGRIPLREHHSLRLDLPESGSGPVLELKNRWWGVLQKLYFDETKKQLHQVEFFNKMGSLEYRVKFENMKTNNGYRIPHRLHLSNDEGVDVLFRIDRFWANIEVSPSMFVLQPTGS